MERTNLIRVFMYSGVCLQDPDPALNPIAVRDLYAAAGRPELSNAEVRGPEIVGDQLQYTLHRAVGTKGLKKTQARDDTLAKFDDALAKVYRARKQRITEKTQRLLTLIGRDGAKPLAVPSQAMPWVL